MAASVSLILLLGLRGVCLFVLLLTCRKSLSFEVSHLLTVEEQEFFFYHVFALLLLIQVYFLQGHLCLKVVKEQEV